MGDWEDENRAVIRMVVLILLAGIYYFQIRKKN